MEAAVVALIYASFMAYKVRMELEGRGGVGVARVEGDSFSYNRPRLGNAFKFAACTFMQTSCFLPRDRGREVVPISLHSWSRQHLRSS